MTRIYKTVELAFDVSVSGPRGEEEAVIETVWAEGAEGSVQAGGKLVRRPITNYAYGAFPTALQSEIEEEALEHANEPDDDTDPQEDR